MADLSPTSYGNLFGIIGGILNKPANPTVSPSTNSGNVLTKTPGLNYTDNQPKPSNALWDNVTNQGLNPIWLLVALIAFFLIKGRGK